MVFNYEKVYAKELAAKCELCGAVATREVLPWLMPNGEPMLGGAAPRLTHKDGCANGPQPGDVSLAGL